MRRIVTTAVVLAAALSFAAPAVAQVTEGSVEILSGATDCTTRDRELDATLGYRYLFRCISGGIKQFTFGFFPIDSNGDPDDSQAIVDDDLSDVIGAYFDLGWDVATGEVLFDPAEFNQSAPIVVFYRNNCEPTNCTVPGDDPATAFLTLPVAGSSIVSKWRIIPPGPDRMCDYGNGPEPCWSYIDCNDVKHYAACTADGVSPGYTPAYPPCDECPATISLEQSTWGRLKALYRD